MARGREYEVELGEHRYAVVPQKLGRLRHSLREAFRGSDVEVEDGVAVLESETPSDLVSSLGDQAHKLLSVFIPGLMPEWEWQGYPSEDAYRRRVAADRAGEAALERVREALEARAEALAAEDQEAHEAARRAEVEARADARKAADEGDAQYAPEADRSPDPDQIVGAVEVCMKANRIDLLKHLRGLVGPDFLQSQLQQAIGGYLTSGSSSSSSTSTPDTPTTTSRTPAPTAETSGTAWAGPGFDVVPTLEPTETEPASAA